MMKFLLLLVLTYCISPCIESATVKPTRKPSFKPSSKSSLKPSLKSTSKSSLKSTSKSSLKPSFKPTNKNVQTNRPTAKPQSNPSFGYYSAAGNQIVDASGNKVRIVGINWFGFETTDFVPGGLKIRTYKSILYQLKTTGFNAVRIPFCNEMLAVTSTSNKNIDYTVNPDLEKLTPLQILDKIVAYAGSIGLRIMLDRHSALPGNFASECNVFIDGNPTYTLNRFISDWVMLAKRYANTAVIAADLWNEAHAIADAVDCVTWGSGNKKTDYDYIMAQAGNAILAVNPNWLIVVEGFYQCPFTNYFGVWWGSDLSCVETHPVVISNKKKLVYSTHDYSPDVGQFVDGVWNTVPWFSDPSFPKNMPQIWYERWGYLVQKNIAPVLMGEWGFHLNNPNNPSYEATKIPWIKSLTAYMNGFYSLTNVNSLPAGNKGMGFFFWALNPSADLQGFMKDDWKTVNPTSLQYVQPLLVGSKLLP